MPKESDVVSMIDRGVEDHPGRGRDARVIVRVELELDVRLNLREGPAPIADLRVGQVQPHFHHRRDAHDDARHEDLELAGVGRRSLHQVIELEVALLRGHGIGRWNVEDRRLGPARRRRHEHRADCADPPKTFAIRHTHSNHRTPSRLGKHRRHERPPVPVSSVAPAVHLSRGLDAIHHRCDTDSSAEHETVAA